MIRYSVLPYIYSLNILVPKPVKLVRVMFTKWNTCYNGLNIFDSKFSTESGNVRTKTTEE